MSRHWSLFSSSGGSLREMCMASLISKVMVWLARSRIRVSSQRGWWCLDQACSAIADFSVSPFFWLPGAPSNASAVPTTAGDLVNYSRCFQCRVKDVFLYYSLWGLLYSFCAYEILKLYVVLHLAVAIACVSNISMACQFCVQGQRV